MIEDREAEAIVPGTETVKGLKFIPAAGLPLLKELKIPPSRPEDERQT